MTAGHHVELQEEYFSICASLSDYSDGGRDCERYRALERERARLAALLREHEGPATSDKLEAMRMHGIPLAELANEAEAEEAAAAAAPEVISRQFLLAGRAVFTAGSERGHLTFKVNKSRDDGRPGGPKYFASVKAGSDWDYIGLLDPQTLALVKTMNARRAEDAVECRAFRRAMAIIAGTAQLAPGGFIRHAGRCGRCGRELTHPRSLRTGLGPECEGRL